MTKVKICGVTRQEDASFACALGADFIGFIFVDESPRCVAAEAVAEIATTAKRVGVFRNQTIEAVRRIATIAKLDLVQLHGDETYRLELPIIKALHVQETLPDTNADADYLLYDTGGGTGRTFDWRLLAHHTHTKPYFLAGGITPANVADAIAIARPFAIDVASGVESAPGIKDHQKLRELFARIDR